MEPTDAAEDAATGMKLIIVVSIQDAETSVVEIDTDAIDRDTVESEIREGLLQNSFIEIPVVQEGQKATAFLNVDVNLISITVAEVAVDA